jgi:quinoprotein glucose dehydrogenase
MRLFPYLILASALHAADLRSFATWTQYLGGADSSQYSSLKQINKGNVSQLEVAWTYSIGDNNQYLFNPIVVNNVIDQFPGGAGCRDR